MNYRGPVIMTTCDVLTKKTSKQHRHPSKRMVFALSIHCCLRGPISLQVLILPPSASWTISSNSLIVLQNFHHPFISLARNSLHGSCKALLRSERKNTAQLNTPTHPCNSLDYGPRLHGVTIGSGLTQAKRHNSSDAKKKKRRKARPETLPARGANFGMR